MSNLQIITTSDGSHSLLNTTLNETYHSVHGALQESLHVFIKMGLKFFIDQYPAKEIRILEVGFGTGLNALLTLQVSTNNLININYTSIETFPLDEEIWRKLNYAQSPVEQGNFQKLHSANWNEGTAINSNFKILKLHTTLQQLNAAAGSYDLIYFDAFAPNKQPEMWELPVLEKIVSLMSTSSVFVTYCAKGQLKRDLKSLGLSVETLEGPPGKKEMVRAIKNNTPVTV
jgi:tRNA U34 5-methylaminomethyl-2-thiouridine-forming methyltransferase MnmC